MHSPDFSIDRIKLDAFHIEIIHNANEPDPFFMYFAWYKDDNISIEKLNAFH